jgi:predicted nucleic acid-binding protein
LPEIAGAIGRRSGQPAHGHRAVRAVRLIARLELVALDAPLIDLSVRLAAEPKVRGTDATYVAVAYLRGLPLVTWDREQLTRAATVIQTRTP